MTNNTFIIDDKTISMIADKIQSYIEKKEWLNTKELHKEYGMSISRQATLRSEGVLPYHKLNSYVFYKRSDIDNLLDSLKVV